VAGSLHRSEGQAAEVELVVVRELDVDLLGVGCLRPADFGVWECAAQVVSASDVVCVNVCLEQLLEFQIILLNELSLDVHILLDRVYQSDF
jgi:hypothetical protein